MNSFGVGHFPLDAVDPESRYRLLTKVQLIRP